MSFLSRKQIINCKTPAGLDLKTVAIRYTRDVQPSPNGIILVLAHAVGCHKEVWLPVLDRIWSKSGLNISEAWSIEGPNHGDALVYNKTLLDSDPKALSDLACYGQVFVAFLNSGLVDYTRRDVVAIVHSAGCQAAIHSAAAFIRDGNPVPFKSVILVEPVLLPTEICNALLSRLVKPCAARQWQWKSRQEATQFVKKSFPWKTWHQEVIDIFVEHGMVHTFQGSQLKLPSHVEAACYPNTEEQVAGLNNLPALCERIPVHILFGARHDLVPKKFRDPFITSFKEQVASLRLVQDAGHMLPHENPDGFAEAVIAILRENTSNDGQRSKL